MKKNLVKHFVSLLGLSFFVALLIGSSSPKAATSTRKVATFDYNPPSKADLGSAKMTLAIIRPQFAPDFKYSLISPFTDFAEAMGNKFQDIIIDRGFNYRGPFKSSGDMVYDDEKQCELAVYIFADIRLNFGNVMWHSNYNAFTKQTQYTFDGYMVLSGTITIWGTEPLTGEKVWHKDIPLDQKSVPVKSEQAYVSSDNNQFNYAFQGDNGMINPTIDALEDYFKVVMGSVWEHLNPDELTQLKPQIEEIRKNASFKEH